MTLAEAVGRAAGECTDERALADIRRAVDDDLEAAARSQDYRERALAYRAIGQLRFNQKTELLRRGLEDTSPAARGSALLSLELLSRDHPGPRQRRARHAARARERGPQQGRPPARGPLAEERLAPADTITLLAHMAEEADDKELRAAAAAVHRVLKKTGLRARALDARGASGLTRSLQFVKLQSFKN